MKGNYPFACLHAIQNYTQAEALAYIRSLSKDEMTLREAAEYMKAVIVTQGQPHLVDLYETEGEIA